MSVRPQNGLVQGQSPRLCAKCVYMYIVIMKCMDIGVPAAPKRRRERPQARRAHCPAAPLQDHHVRRRTVQQAHK